MSKRLKSGLLGAAVIHILLLFYAPVWSQPNHIDVVFAPSSLEVALVSPVTPIIKKNHIEKTKLIKIEISKQELIEKIIEKRQVEQSELIQDEPRRKEKKEFKDIVVEQKKEIHVNIKKVLPKIEIKIDEPMHHIQRNVLSGALIEATPNQYYNSPPYYPRFAKDRGYEGRVLVKVYITKEGYVKSVEILTSSGYKILDNTTLKSVRRWRFQPAKRLGTSVESVLKIPFVFKLNNV